jgi:hypothetical protein
MILGLDQHRTIYDPATDAFYVISAPVIYCFKKVGGTVVIHHQKTITFLVDTYVRSIKIIDGLMYIISGNGYINAVNYTDQSYSIVNSYHVPAFMAYMNDIAKIGDYFYMTATQDSTQAVVPSAVRIQDLSRLIHNEYEDIYHLLGFTKTPYFIEVFDGKVFIPEIGEVSRIMSFDVADLTLSSYTDYFVYGLPAAADTRRQNTYPL